MMHAHSTNVLWAAALLAALCAPAPAYASDAGLRFAPNMEKHIDLVATPIVPVVGRATVANLQTFTGALGDVEASAILQSNDATRPFEVDGESFKDYETAAGRACDNQHNSCADAANQQKSSTFSVGDCDSQNTAASSATQTAFFALQTSTSDFDIFCDL